MPDRIRIVVIDADPLFRVGVALTLRSASDMEVVGEGATADDAVRICKSHAPDIILLNVCIPGGGIKAAQEIRQICTSVNTVMLAVLDNERHVADALQCDVNGYVLKDINGEELLTIVRAVQNHELYIPPSLATRQSVIDVGSRFVGAATLTYRETEVLQLLLQGLMNKEIAHRLETTERTIKFHMSGLLQKLKARNRVEAVLIAGKRSDGEAIYESPTNAWSVRAGAADQRLIDTSVAGRPLCPPRRPESR
jgi:DNA-binding NarL/FixJ family response regulator